MVSLFIAFATFLWYRKGKLWNFYDTVLGKCIKQIIDNSMDRPAWEQIAREQCNLLSKEVFNSLFRFELEYLNKQINDNEHTFWISDSSASSGKHTVYIDKERYCRYKFKEIFFGDLRYCGLYLFIHSITYHFCKKEDTDKGYPEENLVK
jgi:hypothetical protein